jgi:hypothetical protein
MTVRLEIERLSGLDVRPVVGHGKTAIADGACPGCKAEPFEIRCHHLEADPDGVPRAGARCVACNDPVGWVYATPDTLFSAEEDAAVLEHGRARIYGRTQPRG